MNVSRQVGDDEPLMIAWKAFQATEEFANAKRWAQQLQVTVAYGPEVQVQHPHLEGSLWAMFMNGFLAGQRTTEGKDA